ncbi:MAG: energy transducer TonB [Vulcanimicrobiaceae bacterium]
MKFSPLVVVAALTLASLATPALALDKSSPTITLVPFSPSYIAVQNPSTRCNKAAAVDGLPFFEMPEIAAGQGISGTTAVKIDLTPAGSLAREELFLSSGNPWLDSAAMRSARLTRFTSEVVSCKHVGGTYLYEVEF